MAVQEDQQDPEAPAHPLDDLVADPTGLPPMCSVEGFGAFLESWVADCAPRLFAVVEEYGERVDARIAGWGIAFEDRADVFGVDGMTYKGLSSAETALRYFGFGSHINARLVWFNAEAAEPAPDGRKAPGELRGPSDCPMCT